ncbi:MAG: 50S ribosomal protein L19 [Candidatus Omnitrophica bacterium]|nr:50S ribosomal protein L19 [Candidatus Omnitrophota bacterium]
MTRSASESAGSTWLQQVTALGQKAAYPQFGPGDQVRVWCRIPERDRTRLAPFEGIVIRRRGSGISETVTIRRVTYGEGVERIFPLHAPVLERVEVLRRARVHRARLYFLRTKVGKTRLAAETKGTGKSQDEGRQADAPRPAPEEPQAPQSQEQPAAS